MLCLFKILCLFSICFIYTVPQASSFKHKPCINKVALPFFAGEMKDHRSSVRKLSTYITAMISYVLNVFFMLGTMPYNKVEKRANHCIENNVNNALSQSEFETSHVTGGKREKTQNRRHMH